MGHSPDFFFWKILNIFCQELVFLCMAVVEQLGDGSGRWYAQLATIWHWYLPLSFFLSLFSIVSVHSFFLFLFSFFFNLVLIG